jgi:hypothetical protein
MSPPVSLGRIAWEARSPRRAALCPPEEDLRLERRSRKSGIEPSAGNLFIPALRFRELEETGITELKNSGFPGRAGHLGRLRVVRQFDHTGFPG